jgi:hypothetical protein
MRSETRSLNVIGRHPEGPRFQVDPRLEPRAAQPRAEGSRVERHCGRMLMNFNYELF